MPFFTASAPIWLQACNQLKELEVDKRSITRKSGWEGGRGRFEKENKEEQLLHKYKSQASS